ncbi:MAG: Rrf2 family transcriptional regulator [Deinococcota bacterium]
MRLSSTDIYAFQALGYLGIQEATRWVGSDDISLATGVAKPYLARILATLCQHDIVVSKKGAGGGYKLARPAEDISLKQVMRAIDGPVAPLACVSLNWHQDCQQAPTCHVQGRVWTRLRDAILDILDDVSVADLAQDFRNGVTYDACLQHLLRPSL